MLKEAQYYQKKSETDVICGLCPHNCEIPDGKSGICKVRTNRKGILYSDNYCKVSAIHLDPVEKKPLYHFYPGKNILSVGSIGCNLKCKFCQNSSISQISVSEFDNAKIIRPELIVSEAEKHRNNIGVAYTYNEPAVWYEFMYEIAVKIKKKKLKNVVVSNGYINEKPLSDLIPYIDAFNIDIKAFTDEFYRKQTKSSLKPVLNTIRQIHSAGKHLELTNLIIPGLNDNPEIFKELLNEIINISGKNTVLHLSRYFPNYKMKRNETPHDTMMNLFHIAEQFLNYVYIGNMINTEGNNTYCPNCGELLIIRNRYMSRLIGITNSKCDKCNLKIPIVN